MLSINGILALFGKREFLLFAVVGGFAAAVNWLSRMGFSLVMPFEYAIVIAYVVGMTVAYTLNRVLVFERSGRAVHDEYTRFAIVNVIALVQVWLVSVALANFVFPALNWTFYPEAMAHGVGVASPIVTSYLGHRFFTYSKK